MPHARFTRLLGLCSTLMVLACPWTGQYSATIQGVTVVMTMNCSGTQLSGRIEAEGYPYTLDLTIDGDSARGTFTDPALGGVLSCRASHMDDHVHLSIGEVEVDQDVVPLRWTFTRVAVPAPAVARFACEQNHDEANFRVSKIAGK